MEVKMLFIPSEIHIFSLGIPIYGIMITLGMIAGITIACFLAKKKENLSADDILTLALYVIPLSILGARTYYCIFAETKPVFWEIWNGGLAILGGVIGGFIGIVLYTLIHKKNLLDILDVAAPALILGQSIGRIGCIFGGCCYGWEVTDPAFQFFPIAVPHGDEWHLATMFYESILCLVGFFGLWQIFKKFHTTRSVTACCYLIYYGFIRCIIETFRGDSLYLFAGIKVSQLVSFLCLVGGIIGLIIIHNKNKNKNETNKDSV